MHTSTFWLKFGSLNPAVTLKIRSRSPKPKQIFIISNCYIRANLVKIHPLVHEISYKQESVTPTPTPTLTPTPIGSAQKTICPPPLIQLHQSILTIMSANNPTNAYVYIHGNEMHFLLQWWLQDLTYYYIRLLTPVAI